jgi:hypothetical protein
MNTTKYLALTPIDLTTIAPEDIAEALEEFGCEQVIIDGHHYATAKSFKTLANMLFAVDLHGAIVEFTGIYDSTEKTVTTEMSEE